MSLVEWTPLAEKSLADIYRYIAYEAKSPNRTAAVLVLQKIAAKCERYARSPELGDRRHELSPDLRCFPVGNYVVFYRPQPDGITVVLGIHGARDIPAVVRRLFETMDDESQSETPQ